MAKRRPAGDGMVRKREDGRWEGRIVIGHKENGEPLFRHVYAKTQKALLDKLHQNIECYRDVELTEDSLMTLGEWLDRWLAEYKDGTIRPGTLENYRNYIENYIKPQLGGKQISLITTQDVQRMYRRLKSGGRVREDAEGSKRLSDSTVRHIHTMLHGAMKAAVQAHIIPKNPTENATAPKLNYKPMQVLSEQELDTFLQAVQKDDIWRDFFYTELMTGLRRGEICALMWRDFDAKAGTLGISRTLHSKGQGIYALGDTKTSQGNRTIILPESVAAPFFGRGLFQQNAGALVSSEVVAAATVGTDRLKSANDLLNALKAFCIIKTIILHDFLNTKKRLVADRLYDVFQRARLKCRNIYFNLLSFEQMNKNFLIELHSLPPV